MKFGIALGTLNPGLWPEATRLADELGFESVWLPEHVVFPVEMGGSPRHGEDHPPVPADVPVFEPFTYLAWLAGQTTRVRFGTHVYNLALRHPFVAARAVTTLDVVSGGRLDFGIGAGWLEAEWRALQLDFATRGRRLDEALGVCCRLWCDPVVEHHGEFFDFDAVRFEPKPVQRPWPPIHVGGDGPAALRRAAVTGDGWIPMNHTLEQIPAAVAELARRRSEAGRAGRVEVTLGGAATGPGDVERHAAAGVDRMIVRPWQRSSQALDAMRRFADEVLAPALPGTPPA